VNREKGFSIPFFTVRGLLISKGIENRFSIGLARVGSNKHSLGMKISFYCAWLAASVSVLHAETQVYEAPLPAALPAAWAVMEDVTDAKCEPDGFVAEAAKFAKAKDHDRAFAWLQRAAREDCANADDIAGDDDFSQMRKDERWAKLLDYLRACDNAWASSGFSREILITPTGYDGKRPIPVVLGLHGYGSWPEDFTGADHQKICDDLDVAFFSLSGTIPLGRNSFMWSARHEDDWSRIQKALKRVEGQVAVKPGQIMAVGFSMGGQLAVHLTAAFSQQMSGCLAMSPGSRYPGRLLEVLEATPQQRTGQSIFLSWISAEGAVIKARCQEQAALLEKHGVSSYVHEFPGKGHHFPRAYADYYSIALQVIRKGAEKR